MNGIYGYRPKTEQERSDYERFLRLYEEDAEGAKGRGSNGHLAATALVLDRTGENVLLIKHKIFGAYSAPGGHADGETSPLKTAIREVKEETGIDAVPYRLEAAAFRMLPVKAHTRRGEAVAEHAHFVFCFILTALNKETVNCEEECDDALFVPLKDIKNYLTESHMADFYDSALTTYKAWKEEKEIVFNALPKLLVPWFIKNKRDLPWRKEKTPYRVWLSEIMLQQTRVEAVKDYYTRFLNAAPEVETLSCMSEDKLSKLWEGLGYYSRMRNLKKTADIVVKEFGGAFPETKEELLRLPGVGDYTAGAIASIAFGQKSAAVDGNVVRVVSRLTEDFYTADANFYKKELEKRLESIYPDGSESDFTESLMELGATVCLPNGAPLCPLCPLESTCLARRADAAFLLPTAKAKPKRKTVFLTVFVIKDVEGRYALRRRGEKGVLSGMWEFPNVDGTLSREEAVNRLVALGYAGIELSESRAAKHVFTHLTWEMTVFEGTAKSFPQDVRIIGTEELNREISLPTAFKKLISKERKP